jgi:hypothetical protein
MIKVVAKFNLLSVIYLLLISSVLHGSNSLSVHGNVEWDLGFSKARDTVLNVEGMGSEELEDSLWCFVNPEIIASERFGFHSRTRLQKSLIQNASANLYVDQAYFNYNINHRMSLSTGKKRLPWGYSYLWNPTLILNPQRYIFEPERYSEGLPLFVLEYTGRTVSPKLFWAGESMEQKEKLKLENSYLGFQIEGYFSGLELFLNGLTSSKREKSVGLGIRKDVSGFIVHIEGSVVKNSQRRYFYDPSTLNEGDKIYYTKDQDWCTVLTAGFNRMLSENDFLIFEYFYDRTGFQGAEFDNFVNSLVYFKEKSMQAMDEYYTQSFSEVLRAYTPGSIRQNYAYLAYSHRLKKDWNFGLRALASLDDGSGFISPSISFSATTNCLIEIEGCNPFYTEPNSEFGLLPLEWSTMMKIKIFF